MHRGLFNQIAPLLLMASSIVGSCSALAEEQVKPVLKQPLEGTNGLEANIAIVEVGPGHQTERHVHPGHVFVYVDEGAVELLVDGKEPVRVSAGEAAYEEPNQPMTGRNASSTEGARLIIFQVGEAGRPLEVPADH